MTSIMGEQMTLQDLGMPSTKMFQGPCQAIKTNSAAVKTSAASSKHSHKSAKKTFAFLDLRGGGHTADASSWNTEASLGESWTHSISEHHKDGSASVFCVTSTDLRQNGFCLTLNLSDQPREVNPSLLSEVLDEDADPKYNLSSKACRGILNRANKRGKKLPEVLEEALKNQIDDEELS